MPRQRQTLAPAERQHLQALHRMRDRMQARADGTDPRRPGPHPPRPGSAAATHLARGLARAAERVAAGLERLRAGRGIPHGKVLGFDVETGELTIDDPAP